jgi:hypothetical protein
VPAREPPADLVQVLLRAPIIERVEVGRHRRVREPRTLMLAAVRAGWR